MRVHDQQMLHGVVVPRGHAAHALAAAMLVAVSIGRYALDIARLADRHDNPLVRLQLGAGEVERLVGYLRAALVAVLLLERAQLFLHFRQHLRLAGEQLFHLGDGGADFVVFLLQLLAFERGEAAQLHVENRLRLVFLQPEALYQLFSRRLRALGRADEANHLIEIADCDSQPGEYPRAMPRPSQLELRPPPNHLAPELDELLKRLPKRDYARHPVHQRQHVGGERALHGGELVQVVEDDLRLDVRAQLEHHAHPLPVGFVAHVGYAFQLALLHQRRDLLDHRRLVHVIGQLADDYSHPPGALHRLDGRLRADDYLPAPVGVGVFDPLRPHDDAAGGEVGPLDEAHKVLDRGVGTVYEMYQRVADFGRVVRRYVRRHAHGDAGRAVDEQIRQARGQDGRLLERAVEVFGEVDRLLVDVGEHLVRDGREPRFGVAHRGGRVVVDRAEVALPVDQRRAQRERLRHANQRVVNRPLAVRVPLAQDLAHEPRALLVRGIRAHAQVVHRVEYAPLNGLQPVPNVRQRARDYHAHGVVEI